MPKLSEGLLEKGYWEPAKQTEKVPILHRAGRWVTDLVRPVVWYKAKAASPTGRRTAYLDGLRGFAAFLVYWQHHQLWAHEAAQTVYEEGWGYKGEHYFVQLPFIRLVFSGGHFAVTIFFVISGYVLSAKPLSLIQSGDFVKLGDNVGSALFRRWIRLFLPLIVTSFIYMCFIALVWTPAFPKMQSNFRDELWMWYVEMKNFSFIFRVGGEPWFNYNFHAWSMPVEYKGSIVVYTAAMAFSRCSRNARLCLHLFLMWYFMYVVDGWYCALFCSGMLLCDLDLLHANDNLPAIFKYLANFNHKYLWYSMLVVALYLGGVPSNTVDILCLRETPGWYYLSFFKPQAVWDYKWFYLLWASTFMVACAPRIYWLKSFFESRFCQYLGRISYAFYLVHGPVLWTLAERLYAATGMTRESNSYTAPSWINAWPLSRSGPLGMEMAFLAPHLILLPVTFWLAEIVTRMVDEPSVRLAQWLYQQALAPPIKL